MGPHEYRPTQLCAECGGNPGGREHRCPECFHAYHKGWCRERDAEVACDCRVA